MSQRKPAARSPQRDLATETPRLAPRTRTGPVERTTARPKGLQEEFDAYAREDEMGLSVEPQELGRQFLEEAVQEGDYETHLEGSEAYDVSSTPRGDDARPGPGFDVERNVWENSVNLTLQDGRKGSSELLPPAPAILRDDEEEDEALYLDVEERDLDLTEPVVREASLFDHEQGELGEVAQPELNTDDTHSHEHRRGGHAPHRARRRTRTG